MRATDSGGGPAKQGDHVAGDRIATHPVTVCSGAVTSSTEFGVAAAAVHLADHDLGAAGGCLRGWHQ